jgi:thiazole synthase
MQDTLVLAADDSLVVAGRRYRSRLLTGTGKFKDFDETRRATQAAGAQIVTVAIRRTNLGQSPGEPNLLDVLPPDEFTLLPNTAGCYTADEAVRTCRLARELGMAEFVKLEVIGDAKTLFPDNEQTLAAAKTLIADGFTVLPYVTDDPIVCRKLEDAGCAAVMPLASPIGSGRGLKLRHAIEIMVEQAEVPVVVDAGLGAPSQAAEAMELGADAVLVNTAIARADDPAAMARAFRLAVEAGRAARHAGLIDERETAEASSPAGGLATRS